MMGEAVIEKQCILNEHAKQIQILMVPGNGYVTESLARAQMMYRLFDDVQIV